MLGSVTLIRECKVDKIRIKTLHLGKAKRKRKESINNPN